MADQSSAPPSQSGQTLRPVSQLSPHTSQSVPVPSQAKQGFELPSVALPVPLQSLQSIEFSRCGFIGVQTVCPASRVGYHAAMPDLTRWEDVRRLLDTELTEVPQAVAIEASNQARKVAWHRRIAREERENPDALGNAMLHFARAQKWPQLTLPQAGAAYVRLSQALLFVDLLLATDSEISGFAVVRPEQETPLEQTLQFLLLDLWEASGRAYWLAWIEAEARKA